MMIEYYPHGRMRLSGLIRCIAIETEVVKECDKHPDFYLNTGKGFDSAYQHAEALIEMGHITGVERSQLHYAIEQFLHEEVGESCPECGAKSGRWGETSTEFAGITNR